MKTLLLALGIAFAGALVATPPDAFAQQGQGQHRGGPPPGYGPGPGYGGGQRGYDNPRQDHPRRDDYRQRDMERRQQHMSPDDRRDLRRDIRDHGRDVYRNPNR
jgi:hypothetical protein